MKSMQIIKRKILRYNYESTVFVNESNRIRLRSLFTGKDSDICSLVGSSNSGVLF